MAPTISYAQRFEDLYLMRCFGDRADGFYIDIGSGHPVYDNVSFAFYLKGWSGITVEPNPWLSRLSRGVRPRDRHVEALVGSASERAATFYLVNEFHGLSTMFENHAQAALTQFGKSAQAITVPLTTLRALCEEGHAPAAFDFLKIDVEGAEPEVLLGGDWERYRPKVVVVEALAPYTLAPAFQQWEPFLAQHGYGYVWFDSLNR
ncbi:MAG TPA: FkbM family methyltransferase, partial [Xanthobacteraceae bacterium]|nr:FkbM family methyltransferase [Xanthobacteraceae bacterium]